LSLAEHLALLDGRSWRLQRRSAVARLTDAARTWDISLPLELPTGRLSLAERQLGEVLLALAEGARSLLLDEPSSALGPLDVERLVRQARALADAGSAVLLVTHRLDEVFGAADDVTVLRGGERVHSGPSTDLDTGELAELIVGERPTSVEEKATSGSPGAIRLEACDLVARSSGGGHGPALRNVSLKVAAGEIVGIAGVAGGGQRTLVEVLSGLHTPDAGTVLLDGRPITGAAERAAELGLAYIPEERLHGLIAEYSVADNAALLRHAERAFCRFGMRRRQAAIDFANGLCEVFDVVPRRPDLPVGALSGGNQQKLLVGRELERGPAAIIAHGPTQGLDIAAAAAIRNDLVRAARRGAAVLVVSADLDEILAIADRILVLTGGRIVDEQARTTASLARLGRSMVGLATVE
jgi:general nucleoside transport system ATP-binding protein